LGWRCFKMGATNGLQAPCHPMHHRRIFLRKMIVWKSAWAWG
jgi:hypothetical protein